MIHAGLNPIRLIFGLIQFLEMKKILCSIFILFLPAFVFADNHSIASGLSPLGIPFEFILFALTLIGVALFHQKTLVVALCGLASVLIYKLFFTELNLVHHIQHEWKILVNLAGLLLGFSLLAKLFEDSHLPKAIPKFLPHDWKGPFYLLIFIFILSAFLDNIAAALIGGSIAHVVFRGKVHLGFLAAIVAASNGGGSGSVLGDTTTTMMWIDGVSPLDVLHAYMAAVPALCFFGFFASRVQHTFHPMLKGSYEMPALDYKKLFICVCILAGAILTNILFDFPALGVWLAIFIGAFITTIHWKEIQKAIPGTVFLLSLVLCASFMPVEKLPPASWHSAFALGFISSVFDNIPLTKLALDQGGYDWGMLAYSVGFGGSMLWFGSSAGVAISNMYPEAKNVLQWIKKGWFIIAAYIIGFFILLATLGWNPHAPHKSTEQQQSIQQTSQEHIL